VRLEFPGHSLDLSCPVVMGIVNVTPDSFSDGGQYRDAAHAAAQARAMAAAGAAILDVGGESTRPGAAPVGAAEEIDRVVPVIEALADLPIPVSIDTSKPEVMRAAVAAGAGMINDVNALRAPGAIEAAAGLDVPVCLMHMQGEPRTMQDAPRYGDVVEEVYGFLAERAAACEAVGIPRDRLVIDPGFGFGKALTHNLILMRYLERFTDAGLPLLVGLSRKSMIGAVLDRPVGERLAGSLALACYAATHGANILRVHDVGPTVDALAMLAAVAGVDDGPQRRRQDG
jgi:dihydropteroate synthase